MTKSDDKIIVDDGSEPFELIIKGKTYNAIIKPFSFDEMTYHMKEGNSKKTIAYWIYSSFDNDVSIAFEDILNQDDTFFEPILNRFLERDNQLKIYFERNSNIDNIYERFYKSYSILQVESIKDVANRILPELKKNLIYGIKESIKINGLISESVKQLETSLTSIKSLLKLSNVSEDRKRVYESNLKKWSEIGWTTPPYSNPYMLYSFPKSKKDMAYTIAYFCDNQEKLFFYLKRDTNTTSNKDLDEAITCYKRQNYKACIMLVFSLIDRFLLDNQGENDGKKKNGERFTGKKAAENIKNRKINNSNFLWSYFGILSTCECIKLFYANGKDFKTQPEIANRNFVMHGMLTRPVTNVDCLQAFHLYYNVLTFLDEEINISLEDMQ